MSFRSKVFLSLLGVALVPLLLFSIFVSRDGRELAMEMFSKRRFVRHSLTRLLLNKDSA